MALFNIGFISRSTLFSSPGGDTIQIEMTAKYLKKLGVNVQIFTTNQKIDYEKFDALHFFNITRPADILAHIYATKIPFFISPIYLDLHEYEQENRKGIQGQIVRRLKPSRFEYLKCIARYLRNGEKINSLRYLLRGHNHSILEILNRCTAILPNSQSELLRIQKAFNYQGKHTIIPCGVDIEIFENDFLKKDENLVLCIGRIEGRKNQLMLIQALYHTQYNLVIIGNPSPNHHAYYAACKKAANDKVSFIENIEQSELLKYYKQAKVHVLPSWFETVGLSSLEAAFCGCNIVVGNKGDVMDYFKTNAWYCNPSSADDILKAVEEAMKAPLSNNLQNEIRDNYNWQIAADKTLMAYKSFLK